MRLEAEVPYRAVLLPILYSSYTPDTPKPNYLMNRTIIILYAYDTAIACQSRKLALATNRLQLHANNLVESFLKWEFADNSIRAK